VAETNAGQRGAALDLAQVFDQPQDPGIAVVDARRRAGDQQGVEPLGLRRRLALLHVEHLVLDAIFAHEAPEHVGVAAVFLDQVRGG
jgi:hypothetical protein